MQFLNLFNILGSIPYFLGFYGSDNKFPSTIVTSKTKYIKRKLEQKGIELVCYGTDGDSRFLKSQKELLKFGNVSNYNGFPLVSDYTKVNYFANQDSEHIKKKLKNHLYDTSDEIIIGNQIATVGHLAILQKTFSKVEHELSPSDLNPLNRMDYK